MNEDEIYQGLFETKTAKGGKAMKLLTVSVSIAILMTWIYRVLHLPASGKWPWIGLFICEFWFSFYWFLTQFNRWNPLYRYTSIHKLSQRYEDKDLPGVDIFVCTADPSIEPPILVINTVLSVMAYNYPPDKLSVYLSDDAGSELMFYALLEASRFAMFWLPFCRKFEVEPRSPNVYFESVQESLDHPIKAREWSSVKKLYEDMKNRVEVATKLGKISTEIREEHNKFQEWENFTPDQHDHAAIIQILLNGGDLDSFDVEGAFLPTLVYVAREKRRHYHHYFKAGALNALIRVSSKISNGSFILNVDCDVYSNNSESIRDSLCYFMDENKGHEIAFVQYPQNYNDLRENDLYACCLRVLNELEISGMDANGGPCYIGSGCFHRRDTLCGATYSREYQRASTRSDKRDNRDRNALEEICKVLASCTYDEKTQWGKEVGLKYGYPSEDLVTGLAIQSRGWKSVYSNPTRTPFIGVSPKSLLRILVQHKRWSEGQFQIALSKCCPLIYGWKRIPLKLQFSYMPYLLWAPYSVPTLFYVVVPSFCLLRKISMFPEITSIWILPFAYIFVVEYGRSLGEFLCCGGTLKAWWNEQRMWLFKRTTSYLYAFLETVLKQIGLIDSEFVITSKVTDEDVSQRYARELMEFGASSPMFTILATLAILNLVCFVIAMKWMVIDSHIFGLESLVLQCVLCGLIVSINWPLYSALFLRNDKGRMPFDVTCKSIILALIVCLVAVY